MARILVIDDSSTARSYIRAALEEAKYDVLEASDGIEALDVLGKNKDIRLILCDSNMPKMDGMTACSKIRAIPELSKVPILMLTTESSPEMRDKGKAIGILGWVTKPFDTARLIATINKIIS